MPAQFQVDLMCGLADSDGHLGWKGDITLSLYACNLEAASCDSRCIHGKVVVGPQNVPLEVGFTEYSTTMGHLLLEGGVARWPYGQNMITLLVANPAWRARCASFKTYDQPTT
jgi:hypothetical protein